MTQYVFKNQNNVYVLNDEKEYVQITNNLKTISYPILSSLIYKRKNNKYYIMTIKNKIAIPQTEEIDFFKCLLFLENNFSDEIAQAFLKACEKK